MDDNNNTPLKDIYAQFIVDLPRLKLFINGILSTHSPEEVMGIIEKEMDTPMQVNFCIYFLTQTSLAKFYKKEFKKIKKDYEHLVDDGSYTVYLDTLKKTISVLKNFSKIYLEGDHTFQLDFASLYISYDLEQHLLSHEWDYDFKDSIFNPTIITIKD